MKLGIMQPYFFPYLGYFDLIHRVDQWVVFDTVPYGPKTWMNRNRILHPSEAWQYITVPVDRHVGQGRICDVRPIDLQAAGQRVRAQLEHYRRGRAPFFRQVVDIVEQTFATGGLQTLSDLNVEGLRRVCAYLGMAFPHRRLSQMALDLPPIAHAGQWALEIADRLGAAAYINPPGGRAIFRPEEWEARGIGLSFTELVSFPYPCGSYTPVEHLSILDVLMWNDPETVMAYLSRQRDNAV